MITYISTDRYNELRAKIDSFDAWVEENHRDRNGWASYPSAEAKTREDYVSTNERGLVDEYEWLTNPPARAFLYTSGKLDGAGRRTITNWAGFVFGYMTMRGPRWQSNFGDWRRNIRVRGTNGCNYAGTIYDTYVRLRKIAL